MAAFAFNPDFFKIISDGERIVFLRENKNQRECYVYINPYLTRFDINMSRQLIDVQSYGGYREYIPGLAEYRIEMSLQGGEIRVIDHPLIMGVDIFDRLSITDYLEIINEKIKQR
jgi:hypothetical protein